MDHKAECQCGFTDRRGIASKQLAFSLSAPLHAPLDAGWRPFMLWRSGKQTAQGDDGALATFGHVQAWLGIDEMRPANRSSKYTLRSSLTLQG